MKQLELIRVSEGFHGTFGMLITEQEEPLCLTLEDVWCDNQRNISCIPEGEYICLRFSSFKFGDTYLVQDVPGREGILFHVGNYAGAPGEIDGDTQGCILLGRALLKNAGRVVGIAHSRTAFRDFLLHLRGEVTFSLRVSRSS